MTGRPQALWPLFEPVEKLPGVGPRAAERLARAGVERPVDLLFAAPAELIDRRPRESVLDFPEDAVATVEVEIGRHRPGDRSAPYVVEARDARATVELVFFRGRGESLAKRFPPGARLVVSGKTRARAGVRQMAHPDFAAPRAEAEALARVQPAYPGLKDVATRTLRGAVGAALDRAPELPEWLDAAHRAETGWPGWRSALAALHAPEGPEDLDPETPPRARLAYDELLSHQLALALARARRRKAKGRATAGDGARRAALLGALPYAPTGAQRRALGEIEADMAESERMMRLLQGDVGAGKTLVAALAMLIAVEAGGQAAMMAPTELLARQHAASLDGLLRAAGARVVLLTGRMGAEARARALAAAASGEADIVVGTHALIQAEVAFADLRLVVVDEQHRFGVRQRMDLAAKGAGADVLLMTATPIPRTLALAGYGDMDVSILDEKPPGRRPIETRMVSIARVGEVVERLRGALAAGARAYWVCPLVEDTETSELTAAEDRFALLRDAFGAEAVRLVHGQMPAAERDAAMGDFASGRARLLVATTVIEVGVDVPEASIMVIERAESFGLAQLHQLRGRVGRGAAASTCLLLYGPLGEAARARLTAMRDTEDGFALAELDLKLRGPGDALGARQSGLPDFRFADLARDEAAMRRARDDARLALARDPDLASERGAALRTLLWLHERDDGLRLLRGG